MPHQFTQFGRPYQWLMASIVIFISIVLFACDSLLAHGTIPAIGYSVLVLLSLSLSRKFVYALATLCSILTWLALALEPPGHPLWVSLFDRSMIVVVVWMTTVLGLQLIRAERQVTQQAEDLQRSNIELEHFASLVSHDLRSPLTTILYTIELALEQSGSKLDVEDRELLATARGTATEMAHMVSRLLEYSRAGHSPLTVEPCNCEAVVAGVLQRLNALLTETRAEVTRDPLPVVGGDSTLLAELFQNLIENAAKYHGLTPPRIHISAQPAHGEYIFSIRDNGAGMQEIDTQRIFQRFIRGTRTGSNKGSGIGLATCKTIVERHRGRIWVASKPQLGSTFYFTLPKATDGEPG